jgi:hypothetical protein
MSDRTFKKRANRFLQISALMALLLLAFLMPNLSVLRIDKAEFLFFLCRTSILLSALILVLYIIRQQVLYSDVSEKKRSVIFGIMSVIAFLICLEILFMFIPRSTVHGTYSTRNWFRWYWKPLNSLGFRDKEPDSARPYILFLGDSFTAGQGINDIRDRFSDIVGSHSDRYNSINIGRLGADTRAEFKTLKGFMNRFHKKPPKLVLQFYENDIIGIIRDSAFLPTPSQDSMIFLKRKDPVTRFLVRGSFLVNYFYWSIPKDPGYDYLSYMRAAYDHPRAYPLLLASLRNIVDLCRENSIELYVVVFPFMTKVEESREIYTDRIIHYFKDQGVHTVDVGELVLDMKPGERVVNTNDRHASVEVNRRVAGALNKIIFMEK